MKLFSFFSKSKNRKNSLSLKIKELLGYLPKNDILFKESLTHKSVSSECNYERLEFLGDSILDATVSKYIFNAYQDLSEGELTQLRSKIVSRKNLNRLGKKLQLEQIIISTFEADEIPENMYGNVLEALIGAIYLDGGQQASIAFIEQHVLNELTNQTFEAIENYKGKLLEWGNKTDAKIEFVTEPDSYAFKSSVIVNGNTVGEGRGKNKKQAEQEAAKGAVEKLNITF